jgi:serine phosphatase RsbU (regulator of sigma subunit)
MGIASWDYDLTSGELWWSENAGPLFGKPRGFVPADFAEAQRMVSPDAGRPVDIEGILALLAAGPVEIERRTMLANGSERWTYHRYFLMTDEAERPVRLAGMMTDIDDRKRREQQDGLLLHASEVLSRSLDIADTLRATVELLVPAHADWCVIELLEDGQLTPVVTAHSDSEKVAWAKQIQSEYPTDMESPVGSPNVVRTGEPEIYRDITDDLLVEHAGDDERLLEILREVGYRSAIIVPLQTRRDVIGTITMVMAESQRQFDDTSLAFVRRLATQMAAFIDNARLHSELARSWEAQRVAVQTMQEGLGPDPLPTLESVGLSAHYAIGGADRVGGDWYDALAVDEQRTALVIGDVVGRGVPAVAAMSEYRNALRALILEGHPPSQALTLLNRFAMAKRPDGEGFATLACAVYDSASGSLTSSSAGHPTFMLRTPDGVVQRVWDRPSPPIGVEETIIYEDIVLTVEPESLLVLYTDGLIERRGESLDRSLARLVKELESAPSEPDAVVKHLLDRLPSYPSTDDVAVMVARFEG